MKPFISALLSNRALCFSARCTYLPFPKTVSLGIKKRFWLLKDLLIIYHLYKFHIVFFEMVLDILLFENGLQNPTLPRKTSIKAYYT